MTGYERLASDSWCSDIENTSIAASGPESRLITESNRGTEKIVQRLHAT